MVPVLPTLACATWERTLVLAVNVLSGTKMTNSMQVFAAMDYLCLQCYTRTWHILQSGNIDRRLERRRVVGPTAIRQQTWHQWIKYLTPLTSNFTGKSARSGSGDGKSLQSTFKAGCEKVVLHCAALPKTT